MAKHTLLTIHYSGKSFPVIDLHEVKDNVYINFLNTSHHYSLHRAEKVSETTDIVTIWCDKQSLDLSKDVFPDQIIFTSRDSNKSPSVHDNGRVKVAQSLGFKNSNRHKQYIMHEVLKPFSPDGGYDLGARRLCFLQNRNLQNTNDNYVAIGASDRKDPMLRTMLSTEKNPFSGQGTTVKCLLGILFFRIE